MQSSAGGAESLCTANVGTLGHINIMALPLERGADGTQPHTHTHWDFLHSALVLSQGEREKRNFTIEPDAFWGCLNIEVRQS